jgi:hypothetical protein
MNTAHVRAEPAISTRNGFMVDLSDFAIAMEISFAGKCPKENPEKGPAFPLLPSNEFVPND